MAIRVEKDPIRCGDLWSAHRNGLAFDDWDLRCELAQIYGRQPCFFMHEPTGAVLPCGTAAGVTQFFGGERFCENNRMLGAEEGFAPLLDHVLALDGNVRLLSWVEDPFKHLGAGNRPFDVPYNQYWIVPAAVDLESHPETLKPQIAKEFRYILRKFEYRGVEPGSWAATLAHLERFVATASESFARRNRTFALDDDLNRKAALAICRAAFDRDALRLTEVVYRGEAVGLCVIVDDPAASEAVYLMNLYTSSPSDASNGVTLAAFFYGATNNRRVNGLRGAFTLKKKYGFVPEPAYAVVKDPSWQVQPQVDLNEDELLALYSRPFGSMAQRS